MIKELEKFNKNNVWNLVPKLENAFIIITKWGWKNKMDKSGKVVRNEDYLVCQGYSK